MTHELKNIYDCCICNATIVTATQQQKADIAILNGKIELIAPSGSLVTHPCKEKIIADDLHILPGVIDTQVHFREPGAKHKEDLHTGSKAAIAGGITSVFEMPNTNPPTTTVKRINDKVNRAQNRMFCDYAFYAGANYHNINDINELENTPGCCGIKVFMGASTGELLIDQDQKLEEIISKISKTAAFHSEDENRINQRKYLREHLKPETHTIWRDTQTAVISTEKLLRYSHKYQKKLHILHISTADEIDMVEKHRARYHDNLITIEVTPQHLTLTTPKAYEELQNYAQMNPPLRDAKQQQKLWQAICNNTVNVIGSDHAPHTKDEKLQPYPLSPSGMPGVQTLVPVMLDHVAKNRLTLQQFVAMTSLNPHKIFQIKNKGKIEPGFDADFTIVNLKEYTFIDNQNMLSKCKWTPFHNRKCQGKVIGTIIRGKKAMWQNYLTTTAFGEIISFQK